MTASAKESPTKPRLLLASDRSDQSVELAGILQAVGEVDTMPTSDIPDAPAGRFSGVVVDINLLLAKDPTLVNSDPYGEGWLLRLRPASLAERDELLGPEEYREHTGE